MGVALGIISIKGGVGKTTIAASLAASLANYYNKKVLLVDGNFSAPNIALHTGILETEKTIHHLLDKKAKIEETIQNKNKIDIIPGSYSYNTKLNYSKLKNELNKIKNKYDFIIIDSSPTLNDETLSVISASDYLFLVMNPDYPTISCSIKTAKLVKQRGKYVAGIINKIRNPSFEITLNQIEKFLELPIIGKMPEEKYAVHSLFYRVPLSLFNSGSAFTREINNIAAMLSNKKEQRPFYEQIFISTLKKESINREVLKNFFYSQYFKNN